jgi:hypothetical protein
MDQVAAGIPQRHLLYCFTFRASNSVGDISSGVRVNTKRTESRYGQETFLFSTKFRPVLGTTRPPIWVNELFPRGKATGA